MPIRATWKKHTLVFARRKKRLERRTRRDKNGNLNGKQSQRREKAKALLAKAHLRVKRARLDFHHKTAYALVRRYDTLYVENLNVRGMLKNHHLARVIADAGWGEFFLILKRTRLQEPSRPLWKCVPSTPVRIVSGCGAYVPKALSCRTHSCPYCGLVLHRDKNVAENIRKKGRDAAFGELAAVNAN